VTVRILAVGNMYPPQHAGGYELVWQQAMRQAQTLGHRVRVLTTDHVEDRSRAEQDGDVHRTLRWYWDLARYEFPRLSRLERLALERHNAAELGRHLDEFRPDVVTWWSMGCMSMSLIEQVRRAGIPAVFVVHDDWLIYGWERDQWIRMWSGRRRAIAGRLAERLSGIPARVDVAHAGGMVFNSRYTLERARAAGVSAARMTVVHPGIDERFLQPTPTEPWRWRMMYAGRIDRQKGIDTAVAALAQLPREATLTVWGSGDQRYTDELLALAERLGVTAQLRIEGFVEHDGLVAAYAGADVVVFPVRWNEPFGLVPLEAMGLDRPVVSTARGGTAEFLEHGVNALVFDAEDPAGLAAAVTLLAERDELRDRLRAGGRRTAASYTAAGFAARTVEEIVGAAAPMLEATAVVSAR
jgi:glycosyltransferase involved in cell wall biosynthesis